MGHACTHNNNNNTIMMNREIPKICRKKGPLSLLFTIVDDDVIYRLNGNNCTLKPCISEKRRRLREKKIGQMQRGVNI